MARIVSVLIFFVSVAMIVSDEDEEYKTLIEPDCQLLKVLVELPIPVEAGYKFEPTHALVTRCIGVNDENQACVYTKAKKERWKVVQIQKMTQAKPEIFLSWLTHENCRYQGRECPLEDSRKCHANGTTHSYDEVLCTCNHFVNIHGETHPVRISDVTAAEIETVVPITATPEGIITTATPPEGADSNAMLQFTYTQQPATTIDNFEMTLPPSRTQDIHSESRNSINGIPVSNIDTNELLANKSTNDTPIGTTNNIINIIPLSNINTTIKIVHNDSVSSIGSDGHLTSYNINDTIVSHISTANNISNDTLVRNIDTTNNISNDTLVRSISITNNITNDTPFSNIGTTINIINVTLISNISTISNIINDTLPSNIGTTNDIINDTLVSNIETTNNITNDTLISNIGTINNMINGTIVSNIDTTNDTLINNIGINDHLIVIPQVESKHEGICITTDQYMALVVLLVLLLVYLVVLSIYVVFIKKTNIRQNSTQAYNPVSEEANLHR